MLQIKNLNVSSNGKEILRNINLNMEKGKVYILIGPNGSGKSTFANAIIGNKKYKTSGKIFFEKEDITNLSTEKRAKKGIFLSFQNPVEVPGVSIFNFLRTARSLINEKKLSFLEFKKMLEEKADFLKIPKVFLEKSINENFSGGEKKKMEMLQLLVLNPKFIILDEIDSGLDENSRNLMLSAIAKIKVEKTILIITHYMDFAEKMKPDKIFRINKGEIENA